MESEDLNDPRNLGFSDAQVALAEEIGIDLGLLHDNLQLSPFERAMQHDEAVRGLEELEGLIEDRG